MPFQTGLRYPLNLGAVLASAPRRCGLYALYNADGCVYIGAANNILSRLLDHIHEPNVCLKKTNPTAFTFEFCPPELIESRQAILLFEYRPPCTDRPELVTRET